MKRKSIERILKKGIAIVLLAAMMVSNSATVTLAETLNGSSTVDASIGVVEGSVNETGLSDASPSAGDETGNKESGGADEIGTSDATGKTGNVDQSGTNDQTVSTDQTDKTEDGSAMTDSSDKPDVGDADADESSESSENLDATGEEGENEEKSALESEALESDEDEEPEIITESGPIKFFSETHGAKTLQARTFNAFKEQSRSDFYRQYYNQLESYNKYAPDVYKFLVNHAEDFINYTPGKDTIRIDLIKDGNDKSFSELNDAYQYAYDAYMEAYAAFDWDHPEIFWLYSNAIGVEAWATYYTTSSGPVVTDLWLVFSPRTVATYPSVANDTFIIDDYVNGGVVDKEAIEKDRNLINTNKEFILSQVRNVTDEDGDGDVDIRDKVLVISDNLVEYNYYNTYLGKVSDRLMSKCRKSSSALNWSDDKPWLTVTSDGMYLYRSGGAYDAPVCEGYSRAFKLICDELGIPCVVVTGDGHMWNYIQTEDGAWYAVDVTWNDCYENGDRYFFPSKTDSRYAGLLNIMRQFIMVGRNTIADDGKTFENTNTGHHHNSSFWNGGRIYPVATLSDDAYENHLLGATISDISAEYTEDGIEISYNTTQPGTYYYILVNDADEIVPSIYDVQDLKTDVTNGSGSGKITFTSAESSAHSKTVTFTIGTADKPLDRGTYKLYLTQLNAQEYISSPDVLKLEGISVSTRLQGIEIQDIPASASQTAGIINTLKLGQGYKLNFKSIPTGFKIRPASEYEDASDNDILVKLSSADSECVAINHDNNAVFAWKVPEENDGTVTITATAYFKKDKDDTSKHVTDTIDIKVAYPTAELIDLYGKKYISFDGLNMYSGWVTYASGRFTKATAYNSSATMYYFMNESDITYNSAEPHKEIDGEDAIECQMATNLLWVKKESGNYDLYRFDANGKCLGVLNRIKDITIDNIPETEPGAIAENILTRGSKYTFTINYVPEKDGVTPDFINDEKGIVAVSSDESSVSIDNITYDKDSKQNITAAHVTVTAKQVTLNRAGDGKYLPVTLTVRTGTPDNKYLPECSVNVYVAYPVGWFKSGDNSYYGYLEDVEDETYTGKAVSLFEGWLTVNGGEDKYYFYSMEDEVNGLGSHYSMATGTVKIDSVYYNFGFDGKLIETVEERGFVELADGTHFYDELGNEVKDKIISDSGKYYYIDPEGLLVTSNFITKTNQIGCFNGQGKEISGVGEENKTYNFYANEKGVLLQGMQHINGKRYYFAEQVYAKENNCVVCDMQTGIVEVSGSHYFFNNYATVDASAGKTKTAIDNGLGSMMYGYFADTEALVDNTRWYYSKPSTDANAGVLQRGRVKVGDEWKQFGNANSENIYDQFAEVKSTYSNGWITFGTYGTDSYDKYYVDSKGQYATGWKQLVGENGIKNYYYFADKKYAADNDVPEGSVVTGLAYIGGKYYFLDTSEDNFGARLYGRVEYTIDDEKHAMFFNTSGVRATGWQKDFTVANDTYDQWDYYDTATGESHGAVLVMNVDGVDPDYYDNPQKAPNWYKMNVDGQNKYFYFISNKTLATGWQTISGHKYYFETANNISKGSMYEGFKKIGNNYYYFMRSSYGTAIPERGWMLTGLTWQDGHTYYANGSGVLYLGWQKIDGEWRFFDRTTGYEITDGVKTENDFWASVGEEKYYFSNGTSMVTGFQTIGGKRYYFSTNTTDGTYGRMAKGFFTVSNKTYYADPTTGVLQTGLVQIGSTTDDRYYFGSDYVMRTGWQNIIDPVTNQNVCYFARAIDVTEGVPLGKILAASTDTYNPNNAFWYDVSNNKGRTDRYYLNNGTSMVTGWQTINGKRYYFDGNGILQIGEFAIGKNYYRANDGSDYSLRQGEVYINRWYRGTSGSQYYNGSGVMLTGWQKLADPDGLGTFTYYLQPVLSDGAYTVVSDKGMMYTGVQVISGKRYVFGKTGHMLTGYVEDPNVTGNFYYLNSSGVSLTGWQNVNGELMYFDPATGIRVLATTSDGFFTAGDRTFYFDASNKMLTGFQTINGDRYYFETNKNSADYGVMKKNEWFVVSNYKYYADEKGRLAKGHTTIQIGDSAYPSSMPAYCFYFDSSYRLTSGWQLINANGIDRLYFDNSVPMTDELYGAELKTDYLGNGFYKVSNDYVLTYGDPVTKSDVDKIYRFVSNKMQTGWQTVDTKSYCFGSDGVLKVGLFKYSNNWFYTYETNEDGSTDKIGGGELYGTVYSGFKTLTADGVTNTYYFNNKGQRLYKWQKIDGKNYYFDPANKGTDGILTGAMVTGRVYIDKVYYYFDENGARIDNGFITSNGNTYYVNSAGKMLTGWQTISTNLGKYKFYFDINGAMQTGLQYIGGQLYYLSEDEEVINGKQYVRGAMYTGYISLDEDNYYFNSNGIAQLGWQKLNIDGTSKWYYFATAYDEVNNGATFAKQYANDYDVQSDGWARVAFPAGDKWYYTPDRKSFVKGLRTIGGVKYYLDSATGEWKYDQLITVSGKQYLLSPANREEPGFDGRVVTNMLWTFGDGSMMYFGSDGVKKTSGWLTYYGRNYYLDPNDNGKAATGFRKVSGKTYYFATDHINEALPKGALVTNYYGSLPGTTGDAAIDKYYFGSDGAMLTGWQQTAMLSNDRLYFDKTTGKQLYGTLTESFVSGYEYEYVHILSVDNALYRVDASGSARCVAGLSDGYYTDKYGKLLTGWQTISYKKYYFATGNDAAGAVTNHSGYTIYPGKMVYGFNTIAGKKYCFSMEDADKGVLKTNMLISDGPLTYYITSSGAIAEGWQKLNVGELGDCKMPDESTVINGNKWHYFATTKDVENGYAGYVGDLQPYTYEQFGSWATVYGRRTYYLLDTKVATGWNRLKRNTNPGDMNPDKVIPYNYYYFDSTGVLQKGLFTISGKQYLSDGKYGGVITGIIDGYYYGGTYGERQTGWKDLKDYDGVTYRYYFSPLTGKMTSGLTNIGSNYYKFDDTTGHLYKGIFTDISTYKDYYADGNGVLKSGWIKYKAAGQDVAQWNYHDPKTFEKQETTSVNVLNADGTKSTPSGWYLINGTNGPEYYYFENNTTLKKGFFTAKEYLFDIYEQAPARKTYKYYADSTGRVLTDPILYVSGARYRVDGYGAIITTAGFDTDLRYYDGNGKMVTGWVTVAGKLYYMNPTTGVRTDNNAFYVGNNRYYSHGEDGVCRRGKNAPLADGTYTTSGLFYGYNTSRFHYVDTNGKFLTGWQTIGGKKYYFNPEYGDDYGYMVTGKQVIGGKTYIFGDWSNSTEPLPQDAVKYGALQMGVVSFYDSASSTQMTTYLGSDGVIKTGWQRIYDSVEKVYKWRYFDPATGAENTDTNTTEISGNNGWLTLDATKTTATRYYITNNAITKGFKTIGGKKYYFDNNGVMATGSVKISGKNYLFGDNKEDGTYGQAYNGFARLTDAGIIRQDDRLNPNGAIYPSDGIKATYFYDENGCRVTGWKSIKCSDNITRKFYFNSLGERYEGVAYVGSTRYVFDSYTGELYTNPSGYSNVYWADSDGDGVQDAYYYVNASGVVQTGWIKCKLPIADTAENPQVAEWHYFDTVTGKLVCCTIDGQDRSDSVVWNGNWVTINNTGDTYYLKDKKTLLKGWQTLAGSVLDPTSKTSNRFYFDNNGVLMLGEFAIGTSKYYADSATGVVTRNGYTYLDGKERFYNSNGVMLTGWQTITYGGTTAKYYFNFDGAKLKGIQKISGVKYALDTTTGKLLVNYYGHISDENMYKTGSNGQILTGWQFISGVAHYFEPSNGAENLRSGTTYDSVSKWGTRELEDGTIEKYYFVNNAVFKGFRTINGKTYYFDSTTGVMRTGHISVSGKDYYMDSTGARVATGMIKDNADYMYVNTSGVINKGWFTVGNAKYYSDPTTGVINTGFVEISGKTYYFDEGDSKDTVGKMHTGFFEVPDCGQSFYDALGSNKYYADGNGVIDKSGWKTIAVSSATDAQKWAYYLSPKAHGNGMPGEMATGEVYIDAKGVVTYEAETGETPEARASYRSDNINNMYKFDETTGAREKTVLYFFGNYHGGDNDANQINTIKSMSKYINTDRRNAVESEDVIFVNSTDISDQKKLYDLGLTKYNPSAGGAVYPLSASSYVSYHNEKNKYVAKNDIAHWDAENSIIAAGADGNVDVYDEQYYAMDVYSRAIDKYGPKNLVLMGASSGAGTALSLALESAADKQPAEIILFSPWVEMSMTNTKCKSLTNAQMGGGTDVGTLKYWGARYTREGSYISEDNTMIYGANAGAGTKYRFASPIYYSTADYRKLKNVYVYTGKYDPCSFDTEDVINRAKAAGAENMVINNYSGKQHGYMFYSSDTTTLQTIRSACWTVMGQK